LSIFEIKIKAGWIWSFMALTSCSMKKEMLETFFFN